MNSLVRIIFIIQKKMFNYYFIIIILFFNMTHDHISSAQKIFILILQDVSLGWRQQLDINYHIKISPFFIIMM